MAGFDSDAFDTDAFSEDAFDFTDVEVVSGPGRGKAFHRLRLMRWFVIAMVLLLG